MQRRHRRAHLHIWMVLAGLLPLVLLFVLALRFTGPGHMGWGRTEPRDAPPQMLARPPIGAPK